MLPSDLPAAVLLSQHMPPGFTLSFAQRLNQCSPLQVKEAEGEESLLTGQALIAPGGYHLVVQKGRAVLDNGPKVNYVKPSVDVMLESLEQCDQKVIVAIMTGMGRDGASAAAQLKTRRPATVLIAQDPADALIPSMPEALLKSADCDYKLPLDQIAPKIYSLARSMV